MDRTNLLDEQFRDALREVEWQLSHQRLAHGELVHAYRAVEQKFVPLYEAAGQSEKVLAVRRSVAWGTFGLALDADRPVGGCEEIFASVVALGFNDLHHEAHVITVFCAYCVRHDAREGLIRGFLDPLIAKLEAQRARSGDAAWNTPLALCNDIIGQLDKRSR